MTPALAGGFIDERAVRWPEVRRVQHTLEQEFRYTYPGPIHDLEHRLIITPRARYGAQSLRCTRVLASSGVELTPHTDAFGNQVVAARAPRVGAALSFSARHTAECVAGAAPVALSAAEARPFYAPTPLTEADAALAGAALGLRALHGGGLEFAGAVSAWVARALSYGAGTSTRTSALGALRLGRGLCQDYAHLMVALCRAAGVAARYVSGHLLGEGGSHAWAEVLLPHGGGFRAHGFDPTNRRVPGLDYLTVAVGRDYRDVAPTSGSFSAPYGGELTATKRAGVTLLEYHSGELLLPDGKVGSGGHMPDQKDIAKDKNALEQKKKEGKDPSDGAVNTPQPGKKPKQEKNEK